MFDIIPLKLKQNSLNKKGSLIAETKNSHAIFKRALGDDLKHKSGYSALAPDYIMPPLKIGRQLLLKEILIKYYRSYI